MSLAMNMLEKMDNNLDWYERNLNTIKNRFNESFVAIKDESVVASSKNLNSLLKQLKQKKINPNEAFISFVSKIKTIF
ncbi:MAG: hypothetical protein MAG795_00554 [Candidatus Woesearchaeota archaeon]|nr:hypothetical protein [Candidatus Woesearchaeota archaeon]